MKTNRSRMLVGVIAMICLLSASHAHARNEYKEFSIDDALANERFKSKLGDEVQFFFGSSRPSVSKTYGEWPSLKKTNAFNKSDEAACQWALLSTLLSLKSRALREGGNAVIKLKTNNDHREKAINSTFECEVGNVIASVAVKGTVVKIDN